jgi:lysozyme family protein
MADFDLAYELGRENEGGYSNDPSDKGGETYAGISRVYYPNCNIWPIVDQHKPLKRGAVIESTELDVRIKQFYRAEKWNKIHGDQILSKGVAAFLYDWTLTSGKAIKKTQELLGVTADGVFGPGTLAALNAAGDEFLQRLHECRGNYYRSLVEKDATQDRFLQGWLNRNDRMLELVA